MYQGEFFPAGDACVTITGPAPVAKDTTNIFGGILLQETNYDWWMPAVWADGTASVERMLNNGWLHPVPQRKFDAVKTGANAVNVLRVVWKAPPAQGSNTPPDPTVTVFINDKQFISFNKMTPNPDRLFGLVADTEGTTTYQFS